MTLLSAEQSRGSARCFPSLCPGKSRGGAMERSPGFRGVLEPLNRRILQSITLGSVPNPRPHQQTFVLALSPQPPHIRTFGVCF